MSTGIEDTIGGSGSVPTPGTAPQTVTSPTDAEKVLHWDEPEQYEPVNAWSEARYMVAVSELRSLLRAHGPQEVAVHLVGAHSDEDLRAVADVLIRASTRRL